MKKILILGLLLCFLCPVFSQNSLFYEISGGQAKQKSYLFGTMHLQKGSLFNWNHRVFDALNRCDVAAFELNTQLAFDVEKLISQEMMDEWEAFFKDDFLPALEVAIPADSLANRVLRFYSPFMEQSMNMVLDSTNRLDFIDAYLQNFARKRNKEILAIESLEEQIEVITSLNKDFIKDVLIKFLQSEDWNASIGGFFQNQSELMNYYEQKDFDRICSFIDQYVNNEEQRELADFYYQIFDLRNEIMFDRTEPRLKSESVFIAVGAGHLCGKNGLVEKFREAGYTVSPIDIATHLPEPKISWKTIQTPYFTVDLPQDVDSIFQVMDDDNFMFDFNKSLASTTFTQKGRATFKVEVVDLGLVSIYHNMSDLSDTLEEPAQEDGIAVGEIQKAIDGGEKFEDADELYNLPPNIVYIKSDSLEREMYREWLEFKTDTATENRGDVEVGKNLEVAENEGTESDYMAQVVQKISSELSPFVMQSMMAGMEEHEGDTMYIDAPEGKLILVYTRKLMGNVLACSIESDSSTDGEVPVIWVLTVTGDPDILKSSDLNRFFTSFKLKL